MREIKFKVFVKLNKSGLEYYSDEEIEFIHSRIHGVITLSLKYGTLSIADEEGVSVVTIFKDRCEVYELMQYTGLKDKNGVEIYEGDIVKILYNQNSDNYAGTNFNYSEHVCSVEFGEYSSRFALRNLTEKYKGRHNFTTIGLDHRRLQRDLIEVIGNIHSNPELLK